MKRILKIIMLLCVFPLLSGSMKVQAEEDNSYESLRRPNETEVAELLECQDQIIEFINTSIEWHNPDMELVTEADIDYEKLVKVYIDTNVFQEESLEKENIDQMVAPASIVWLLHIYRGDQTIEVEISRQSPVPPDMVGDFTGAELAELRRWEGKMKAVAIGFLDEHLDYRERIRNILTENGIDAEAAQVIILGGTPGARYPMAAIFVNNMLSHIIPLVTDIPGADSDTAAFAAADSEDLKKGSLYSFETVAQTVKAQEIQLNQMPVGEGQSNGMSGGSVAGDGNNQSMSPSTQIIIATLLLLLAGGGLLLYWKSEKTGKQDK